MSGSRAGSGPRRRQRRAGRPNRPRAAAASMSVVLLLAGLISVGAVASPAAAAPPPAGPAIVLRPHRIDVTATTGAVRSIGYAGGPIALSQVAGLVADRSLLAAGKPGVYRLAANLVQTPGTVLEIRAPVVTRLDLAPAATIHGSASTLEAVGLTIAAPRDSRAAISYGQGSLVTISNVAFVGLGSAQVPALSLGRRSRATVTRSAFSSTGGIELNSPTTARLDKLLLSDSRGTAVRLSSAPGASVGAITTLRSAGAGIALSGGRSPAVAGPLVSISDAGPALALSGGITGVRIHGIRVRASAPRAGDTTPAVAIGDCHDCRISSAVIAGRAVGVQVSGHSTGVTLSGLTISSSGGSGGVVIAGAARATSVSGLVTQGVATPIVAAGDGVGIESAELHSSLTAVTISRAARHVRLTHILVDGASSALAVASGSDDVAVSGLTATGIRTTGASFGATTGSLQDVSLTTVPTGRTDGLRVAAKVRSLQITGLTVRGARNGVTLARGAQHVVLRGTTIQVRGGTGLSSRADDFIADGLTIAGARAAVIAQGGDVIAHASITGSRRGIIAGGPDRDHYAMVQLRDSTVRVTDVGVQANGGASVTVEHGLIRAARATEGPVVTLATDLPAPGLSWLGIAALMLVSAALALEIIRRSRERGHRPRAVKAPDHVLNVR